MTQTVVSATAVDSLGRGYPRPQLVRNPWHSLNGTWQCALDHDGIWKAPSEVRWDRAIVVPFSPEAPLSGIADTSFFRAVWYQRMFPLPPLKPGHRAILHFGAVDYDATVWVNDELVGTHRGGYTPFCFDVTPMLDGRPAAEITVRAEDDPQDLAKPRGKQDWQRHPHSIWYARTTGIWQTVWCETVPETWIGSLRWTPHMARWEIGM
jgi:beta-galactosidase/beta-glucuronidase